jgi:hypothetical protein
MPICILSEEEFEISKAEKDLRLQFGFEDLPKISPKARFRELGAFWQHWNLHKRKSDFSQKEIISVFSENCPYPVWHRDEWIQNANPRGANFHENKTVFEQMWEFFQKSPIPHNTGTNNENCEFTDDWWFSKNCYLCHCGAENEDCKYCYRILQCKDCQFCVFSFESEMCADLINCNQCFESFYLFNCRNIQNSAFLYDCRNCEHCLFCFNLRNKKYCIGNIQLTKEEFEKKKKEWSFSFRNNYEKAKTIFLKMMKELAWHRGLLIDQCEDSTGNFLEQCNKCENTFFSQCTENAVNTVRMAKNVRTALDVVTSAFICERIFSSTTVHDHCYDIKFCFSVTKSSFLECCAFLQNCEYCFGCCGLVGKKYYIFNKPYSKEEYFPLRERIIAFMKKTGEYGKFFPGYFAANSYDESWSSFYFPLSKEEQANLGFRVSSESQKEKPLNCFDALDISDTPDIEISKKIFWDKTSSRPFQIQKEDVIFSKKLQIPLPNCFYIQRIKENFRWLSFDGKLRKVNCEKCAKEILTNLDASFEHRILCEKCYLSAIA